MIPKEKAEELVRNYYSFGINKEGQSLSWYECKQCALIAIEEVLSIITNSNDYYIMLNYYQQVKKEIENL